MIPNHPIFILVIRRNYLSNIIELPKYFNIIDRRIKFKGDSDYYILSYDKYIEYVDSDNIFHMIKLLTNNTVVELIINIFKSIITEVTYNIINGKLVDCNINDNINNKVIIKYDNIKLQFKYKGKYIISCNDVINNSYNLLIKNSIKIPEIIYTPSGIELLDNNVDIVSLMNFNVSDNVYFEINNVIIWLDLRNAIISVINKFDFMDKLIIKYGKCDEYNTYSFTITYKEDVK